VCFCTVQRNGRFVIPVKNTFKRTGLGIVHDQSNTGKTVYIEPVQVTGTQSAVELQCREWGNREARGRLELWVYANARLD
jgi:dsDNA-specific endonuclease/ATPase MutS2